METLGREFYDRDTVEAARALLGCRLVRITEEGVRLSCIITETEAYRGPVDKACHAWNGRRTPRTETLYARPGTSYVYLIYGMYHCLNFVTEPEGVPCAVLIRGAVPEENAGIMSANRFGVPPDRLKKSQRRDLLRGPGRLCQGLQITRAHNGLDLTDPRGVLSVERGTVPQHVFAGERIGIGYAEEAVHFPWRFWTEDFS